MISRLSSGGSSQTGVKRSKAKLPLSTHCPPGSLAGHHQTVSHAEKESQLTDRSCAPCHTGSCSFQKAQCPAPSEAEGSLVRKQDRRHPPQDRKDHPLEQSDGSEQQPATEEVQRGKEGRQEQCAPTAWSWIELASFKNSRLDLILTFQDRPGSTKYFGHQSLPFPASPYIPPQSSSLPASL